MKNGKHLNTLGSEKTIKAAGDKILIPLIVGLIVTVVGGLVLNSIIQKDTNHISTPEDTIQDDDDDISSSTITDGTPHESTLPEDIMLEDDTFDDPDSNVITSATDGSMSEGTTPEVVPITEEMMEVLATIQKISIGSNKSWVDDKLGPPYAENIVEITAKGRVWPHTVESDIVGDILECIYIFDIVSVIMYFDTHENSCKAYFITLMDNSFGIDIAIPGFYSVFVSDKPLGKFTFSDIRNGYEPLNIYGYVSNGVARAFYGEQYYFAGSGNYQNFYFAVLDYGALNSLSDFIHLMTNIQHDVLPAPQDGISVLSSSDLLVEERQKLYVNTYGISVLNTELTFSLISSYTGFDSASFRKRN